MFKNLFRSSEVKNQEGIREETINRIMKLRKAGFTDKEILSTISVNDKEREVLKLNTMINNIKQEIKENKTKEEVKETAKEETKETAKEEPKEEVKETAKEEVKEINDIINESMLEMLTDDVYDQFKMIFNIKRDKIEKLIMDIILNNPEIVKTNSYYYLCMKLCNIIEDLIMENTIGSDDDEKDPILEELNSLLD